MSSTLRPGRYLLEMIQSMPEVGITALLRDYRQVNIDQGWRIAAAMGLAGVSFEVGDAFDRKQLAKLTPRPTFGIVSGLYELFPKNEPVLRSLQGLADAIEPGGYLAYTNQPWHPQVEFIARVLPNREGEPWVMRRRTQAEMDGLVSRAGFEKVGMLIDRWGIFTVSLAKRL